MKIERILLAYDGSEASERALDFAIELSTGKNTDLRILHVQANRGRSSIPVELERFEEIEHIYMTEREILRGDAEQTIETAVNKARKAGLTNVTGEVREGDATRAILDLAQSLDCDLLVLGSRGLGDLQGLLLGSVSHKVMQAAPCSCVIVR